MSTTSDDSVELEQVSLDNSSTISDPGMASADRESPTAVKLVRNGYVDTAVDYIHIFEKLQLKEDFEEEFFAIMKEYRFREDVREVLEDTGSDLRELSEDFLKTHGKKIWMYRGKHNKQDPRFRETLFKWNNDEDTLWGLLDELWTRVRELLWSSASEGSTVSSMDAEEEAIAVEFINVVRTKHRNEPGTVRARKQLIESIETD